MDALIDWIRSTSASNWINSTVWIWPFCESVHFIGLSMLVGCVGFFDLRLMGFFRSVPVAAARRLMPFAVAGFVLNLLSGVVFLTGLPGQYLHNAVWWSKVAFLALAGINALVFEKTQAPRLVQLPVGSDMPLSAKVLGAVSLVAWLGVLYCGRMLPFLGDAF